MSKQKTTNPFYLFDLIAKLFKSKNIPAILYLTFNIAIVSLIFYELFFKSPIAILYGVVVYLIAAVIAISPVGEWILRLTQGCSKLKTDNPNEQVDDIAMLTFSHSKSNSGIEDLNNSADWEKGAYRLDAYVTAYNTDHPDSQISFNRDQFSGKEKLGVLATESLSLRVGDVSRDSGPDAPAQCGEPVHVEKNLNCDISKATCWKEEVAGFDVTVGDRKLDCNDKDDLKSIRVHAGEQNIAENHTAFDGNRLVHTISVYDGDHAPYCTQEAVKDHVGELASAKNGDFVVELSFDTACSKTAEGKYEEFRDSLYKKDEYGNNPYENVQLKFPWDKE